MPIYEYERPDGTTFELYQGFQDEALTKDPETGVSVRRVLHAPAVHFKGSGFYNTDYGTRKRQREQSSSQGTSENKSTNDGASSGDGPGKSEPKPAGESSNSSEQGSSSNAGSASGSSEKAGKAKAQPVTSK